MSVGNPFATDGFQLQHQLGVVFGEGVSKKADISAEEAQSTQTEQGIQEAHPTAQDT